MSGTSDLFLALLAVLFPPIAVWIKLGICSLASLLNLLLCCLGYVPGLLHAWYIIAKHPDADADYIAIPADREAGQSPRVTYYYVSNDGGMSAPVGGQGVQRPYNQRGNSYGTAAASGAPQRPAQGPRVPQPPSQSSPSSPSGPPDEGGSAEAVPPSYSEAVRGDHKVQT